MNEQVNSIDELYRLGLGFNCGPVQAGFTQGWRYFRWKQVNTLVPGAGDGNVTNPDPRPGRPRRRDRLGRGEQGQHARHQRLGHRKPLRAPQARRLLHEGRRQQRDELRRGRRRQLRRVRDRAVLLGPRRDGQLPRPHGLLARLGARRDRDRPQRDARRRLGREQPHAHRPGPDRQPVPEHRDLRRRADGADPARRSTRGPRSSARTSSTTPT